MQSILGDFIKEHFYDDWLVQNLPSPKRDSLNEYSPNKGEEIDKNLKKTARDIKNNDGSPMQQMDGSAENPMGDPGMASMGAGGGMGDQLPPDEQNIPDGLEQDNELGDEIPDEEMEKPVDSGMFSRVAGHDYIQKYNHARKNKETHPNIILNMDISELKNYLERVRGFLSLKNTNNIVGTYSDQNVKTATDLASFIEKVLEIKDDEAKSEKRREEKNPNKQTVKYNTDQPSKMKAGQYKMPRG